MCLNLWVTLLQYMDAKKFVVQIPYLAMISWPDRCHFSSSACIPRQSDTGKLPAGPGREEIAEATAYPFLRSNT